MHYENNLVEAFKWKCQKFGSGKKEIYALIDDLNYYYNIMYTKYTNKNRNYTIIV